MFLWFWFFLSYFISADLLFIQACNSDEYVSIPRADMETMLKEKGILNANGNVLVFILGLSAWNLIVNSGFLFQDFCRITTPLTTCLRNPVNRKSWGPMTPWPPAWPLSPPGTPLSVAGPPFQDWTATPWPFPGGRPFSSTLCPPPCCRGYPCSMSAPDVARCSGKALTLAVSSLCSRKSYT